MNDAEYRVARATLEDAHKVIRDTAEAVLAAAVVRGDAYVVRAHMHFEVVELPFLTLAEAQEFAGSDDCSPIEIQAPRPVTDYTESVRTVGVLRQAEEGTDGLTNADRARYGELIREQCEEALTDDEKAERMQWLHNRFAPISNKS